MKKPSILRMLRGSIVATCLLAHAASLNAALNDGLVAHFAFENATNLGMDSSGNSRHLSGGGSSAEGIKGKGLILDGFSSLESNNSSAFKTASAFSWSTWFQVEDDLAGAIISKSPEGWLAGSKALFKGEESFLGFDIGFVGAAEFEGEIQDGEWHHAVIVGHFPEEDPIGFFELYVDGVLVSEIEGGLDEVAEPEDAIFRVGGGSPGGFDPEIDGEEFPEPNTFFGNLDEVRIYDRALEPEEVVELLIDGLGELPKPSITSQPQSQQAILGRSLALSVAVDGLLIEYKWFKDGEEIEEATANSLFIEEISADSAGNYTVSASNQSGTSTSQAAKISVVENWEPDVGLAGYWDFETGGQPGNDASGNAVHLENFGVFAADGSKGRGIETGFDAYLRDSDDKLALNTHGNFTWTAMIQSEDQGNILSTSDENWSPGNKGLFVRDGSLGFDTGWIGDAGGGPELIDGDWHHIAVVSQANDEGANQIFYVDGNVVDATDLPFTEQPDSGLFSIGYGSDDFPALEDLAGQDTPNYVGFIDEVRVYRNSLLQDDIITLMLDAGGTTTPPSIAQHPADTVVAKGRSARFQVIANGTAPTYQWQKNGVNIDGENNAEIRIRDASDSDAGEYRAIVGSSFSDTTETSNIAVLSVEDEPVFAGGELSNVAPFLESYWDFNSAPNDTIRDLSPNAPQHDGILTGGAVITSGNQGFGDSGEALDTSFEANAHMAAMDAESYDFNDSFTWSAMVKIFEPAAEGEEAGAGIFGRAPAESGHNNGSKVLYLNGETLGFDTGWVGAVNSEEPILELDTWHHVAMTHDAEEGVISIYLDGESIISNETDEPVEGLEFGVAEFPEDEEFGGGVVNTGFRVGDGAIDFFADPFPGIIDNAAVWSVALSTEEIQLLAGGASPLPDLAPSPTVPVPPIGPLPPIPGGGNQSLSATRNGSQLTIEFTGTLISSNTVDGEFTPVANAASPLMIDLSSTSGAQFYQVQ
jgi:hypothetical protein